MKTSLIEAAAFVGLGIILENPDKRRFVISTLDRAGISVTKVLQGILLQSNVKIGEPPNEPKD